MPCWSCRSATLTQSFALFYIAASESPAILASSNDSTHATSGGFVVGTMASSPLCVDCKCTEPSMTDIV